MQRWNAWRKEEDPPDYSPPDLSEADLGRTDLHHASLAEVEYEGPKSRMSAE